MSCSWKKSYRIPKSMIIVIVQHSWESLPEFVLLLPLAVMSLNLCFCFLINKTEMMTVPISWNVDSFKFKDACKYNQRMGRKAFEKPQFAHDLTVIFMCTVLLDL